MNPKWSETVPDPSMSSEGDREVRMWWPSARACGSLVLRACLPAALALLAGCLGGEQSRRYEAAEQATATRDWPLAAELWYDLLQEESPRTKRTYREAARALCESGDDGSACGLLELGIAEFPGDTELRELRACLLDHSGYRRAAAAAYEEILTIDPDHFGALRALGHLRVELGLERAAEEPLRRAIARQGTDIGVLVDLGRVYTAKEEPALAFQCYSRAIELGCAEPSTLLDAATLVLRPAVDGEHPEARERALGWLDTLCELDPQCTGAHYLRGVYLAELGRSDEAVVALRRAVETDPAYQEALELLARVYVERGELDHATEMVDRALQLERDPERREALKQLVARGESDGR